MFESLLKYIRTPTTFLQTLISKLLIRHSGIALGQFQGYLQ